MRGWEMTMNQSERPGHHGGSSAWSRPDEDHDAHGPMGHSHGGHLLHMVPMVLGLFAPRGGWSVTVGLRAVLGVWGCLAWRNRVRARMAPGTAPVRRPEA